MNLSAHVNAKVAALSVLGIWDAPFGDLLEHLENGLDGAAAGSETGQFALSGALVGDMAVARTGPTFASAEQDELSVNYLGRLTFQVHALGPSDFLDLQLEGPFFPFPVELGTFLSFHQL